jgi:hypothetical protein
MHRDPRVEAPRHDVVDRKDVLAVLEELLATAKASNDESARSALEIAVMSVEDLRPRPGPPTLVHAAAWLYAGADDRRSVGCSAFDESILPIYREIATQLRDIYSGVRTIPTAPSPPIPEVVPDGLWRWTHDPECYALRRLNGDIAATVWTNGCWHTWGFDGIGGENSSEATVEAAMQASLAALIRQGWAETPEPCQHCDGSRYEPEETPSLPDVEKVRECVKVFGQIDGPDALELCDELDRLRAPKGPRDFSSEEPLLDALGQREPWTVQDVLRKLSSAATHLLAAHDCDAHGWEEVASCSKRALELATRIDAHLATTTKTPP